VLVRLDQSDYRAALASANAKIDAATAALENIKARRHLQQSAIEAARADLAAAKARSSFAHTDYARNLKLGEKGTITERRLQQLKMNADTARAEMAKAQAALDSSLRQLTVLNSEQEQKRADLEAAKAAQETARLNLERCTIRAPRDGIVGNRGIEPGDYVGPGSKLMNIVPVRDEYIVANFKETQIENFRPGMKAKVSLDMLGGRSFPAHIVSLAPASGSQFSILPAENATGNFTKIVQRLPVRIRLDKQPPSGPMAPRPGTSVVVSVNTKGAEK
jgi:membrane fusion protein (multidrug efflux system)